ncbi:MAG: protein-disulfide reductase DsbD domain-containing protein, partial [Pseudomonadota bacterium]
DHAWLGVGFIALFDATQDPTWLQRAAQLSDQIMQRFPDRNGRLRMAAEDGPLGPAYENEDGATPAGESSALELFAALALRTQGLEQRSRAEVLLGAISGSLAARPVDRTTALRGALLLRHGDSRPFRWLSSGRVRVEMTRKGRDLKAEIRIADGWHLNAHQQTDEDLIGVSLTGEAVEEAEYPAAVSRTLGFQDAPIQVLEGRQKITAQLAEDGPALVTLTVQACSDEICLAPEDAVFRLR